MVIENRDAVVAGTTLVGMHKKQQYVCTVEAGESGKLAFIYDGKSYNSPSSAGTAIIGTACNGWRFWSIEGEAPDAKATASGKSASAPAKTKGSKRARSTSKKVRVFYRIPNQKDTAEGVTRFYCNGCAASFESESEAPEACPNGHRNDDPDLTTAPTSAAVAADEAEATA
jgi:hypothetical protein